MNLAHDATWQLIERELNSMLARERSRLEDPEQDLNQTNNTRGRISAIKDLLALPIKRAALARNDDPA